MAILCISETTCATIREMEKKGSIIGSPWAKGLGEKKLNTDENGRRIRRILDSPFERDCSSCDMCPGTRQERKKKKTEGKRTRRKKETPRSGVTDQKQNASKCGGRGKIANTREEFTGGRTPTMPARTTDVLLHKATNPPFRNLSTSIDVRHRAIWYDTRRSSAASKWYADRDTLNSRICANVSKLFRDLAQEYPSC